MSMYQAAMQMRRTGMTPRRFEQKQTHAGVLEFIAEEGKIYLPYWVRPFLSLSYFLSHPQSQLPHRENKS